MKAESVLLKNKHLTIEVDNPGSIYNGTRFDWTGFIRQVTFNNITFFSAETENNTTAQAIGAGLCNEFGIVRPIGYDNCPVGQQFPKLGVGLLTRENDEPYRFFKPYPCIPAQIKVLQNSTRRVSFISEIQLTRGYAYKLEKTIKLEDNCLIINYSLHNTGTEIIDTNEYCHNFLAINHSDVSSDYKLQLSFPIEQNNFGETVNPEQAVSIGINTFNWSKTPSQPFFFSNIGKPVDADFNWKLTNTKHMVSISEKVSPTPAEMNLWGIKHVMSPEMFVNICVKPNEMFQWQRKYCFEALQH
jgi:hypothetical protein